jgi:hypothetical protein
MTDKKTKTKKTKKKEVVDEQIPIFSDDKQVVIVNNIQPPVDSTPELRTISLYGPITEQKGYISHTVPQRSK